jgi:hypothetical protein
MPQSSCQTPKFSEVPHKKPIHLGYGRRDWCPKIDMLKTSIAWLEGNGRLWQEQELRVSFKLKAKHRHADHDERREVSEKPSWRMRTGRSLGMAEVEKHSRGEDITEASRSSGCRLVRSSWSCLGNLGLDVVVDSVHIFSCWEERG